MPMQCQEQFGLKCDGPCGTSYEELLLIQVGTRLSDVVDVILDDHDEPVAQVVESAPVYANLCWWCCPPRLRPQPESSIADTVHQAA